MYQNRIYDAKSAAADTDALLLRMQAQSLLTRDGFVAALPTYDEAIIVIANHRAAQAEAA